MSATNPGVTVAASAEVLTGTFPGDLGIELVEISDASVRGRMRVDRRHLHPGGYVHGGCWVALADTVAAWGTLRHLGPDRGFTTVELKMNVLGAGRVGDELVGVGELLHAGNRTQVWEVRVYRNRPEDGDRDQADGSGHDQADGSAAGQADGSGREQADGSGREQADGSGRDQADGSAGERAGGSARPVANFVCTQMIL